MNVKLWSLVSVRVIAISLITMVAGCASSWLDYNYGPAEAMVDLGVVESCGSSTAAGPWMCAVSNHPDYYAYLVNPETTTVYVEDLGPYCGPVADHGAEGCTVASPDWSFVTIYLVERASKEAMADEFKHSKGWCHYEPDWKQYAWMTAAEKQRETRRMRHWFPCEDLPASAFIDESIR